MYWLLEARKQLDKRYHGNEFHQTLCESIISTKCIHSLQVSRLSKEKILSTICVLNVCVVLEQCSWSVCFCVLHFTTKTKKPYEYFHIQPYRVAPALYFEDVVSSHNAWSERDQGQRHNKSMHRFCQVIWKGLRYCNTYFFRWIISLVSIAINMYWQILRAWWLGEWQRKSSFLFFSLKMHTRTLTEYSAGLMKVSSLLMLQHYKVSAQKYLKFTTKRGQVVGWSRLNTSVPFEMQGCLHNVETFFQFGCFKFCCRPDCVHLSICKTGFYIRDDVKRTGAFSNNVAIEM